MKFRSERQHPECATCLRHKFLIRSLGHHLLARQKQMDEYHAHLDSQYQDRLCYWGVRGVSRAGGPAVTLICDGMDQAKFCYPRARCLKSKEFHQFARPKAHIVGMLIHGRAIIFAVTEPDIPKDASTHTELLAFALTKLQEQGECLSEMSLRVQCDNTPREIKNNVVTAWLASLVSKGTFGWGNLMISSWLFQVFVFLLAQFLFFYMWWHRHTHTNQSNTSQKHQGTLREATLSSLRSGHSHEDVDQVFGRLASFLVKHGHSCQTPDDFVNVIQRFLNESSFPNEPMSNRYCVKIDQTRDWCSGEICVSFI